MEPEISDVEHSLEYGHSHEMARKSLPVPLIGVLLGLFLLTSFEGRILSAKHAFGGSLAIFLSLVYLAFIVYRRMKPNVPSIVLSPKGVLFRQFSESVIPWDEIQEIGVARISGYRDIFPTRVTKLVVSQKFFTAPKQSLWATSVIARDGDPSEIYVSYYTPPPFDEFQSAIRCRWQAFSIHAAASASQPATRSVLPNPWPESRRDGRTVQRAESFAGVRALLSLVRSSSPSHLLLMSVLIVGILALATNNLGYWSTNAQREGREKAEEWRQWRRAQEAEQKAFDADQSRVRERFDRMFKCIDQTWKQIDGEGKGRDPSCESEDK